MDGEEHRVAELLEETAARLPMLMDELVAFHRPDVWTGRRADRFGRELEDRHRQMRLTADDLRRQAAELRSRPTPDDLLLGHDG